MDCTRRTFTSRLGMLVAGASLAGALEESAAFAGALTPQHPDHSTQPMTTHASGSDENKLVAPEDIWAKLLEGNQRFAAGKTLAREPVVQQGVAHASQQPKVVVLGCSDSRVSPTVIFDQGLGELFEVRTIGSVADTVALGSIEYALLHLPIRVLLVLGHERCGAVAAAASGQKMATPNLQAVVDRIAPAISHVQGDHKSQDFLRKAEEANVLQCATDLLANSPIVLRETAANNVEIIKAIYSLNTGKVRRL